MPSSNQTIFSHCHGSIPRSLGENGPTQPSDKTCRYQKDRYVRQPVIVQNIYLIRGVLTVRMSNRSDTDSGHSSAQGDRDIYAIYNSESDRNDKVSDKRTTLKVSRTATEESKPCDAPLNKFNPIGYSIQTEMEEKQLEPAKRLQVTRRRDEILKRRNRSRRNTIAVNLLDVEKGNLCQSNVSWDGSGSKSTNCIDKIGNVEDRGLANKIIESRLSRCSMPGERFILRPISQ